MAYKGPMSLKELKDEQRRLELKLSNPETAYVSDAEKLNEVEEQIDKIENRKKYWSKP